MSRVVDVTPETAVGEVAELFERQSRQAGRVSNFHMTMANAPAASIGWRVASQGLRWRYVREDPEFLKVEQMVIVRTSVVNQAEYCLAHNVDLSQEAGISDEQLAAVQDDFEGSPVLTEAQKAAIHWADVVTRMQARDDAAAFERLRGSFSDQQIVELTALIGMWNWSNRFTEALHVELEPPGERLKFEPD